MLSKLFSKKDGDDKDEKNLHSEPPQAPPARPPASAVPPAETPPNVQGGILKPPQKAEGGIAVGRQKRITQRITVAITPPPAGSARAGLKITLPSAKPAPATVPAMPTVSGNVEIPLSVVIPTLPANALKEPAETLLAGEMASKTASIPLASVLSMLPLGKIEFSLKELAAYLPAAGLFKATDEFGDEICSLPLPEIVKRVPPELLARRTDQKPVDEKIKKMEDPFSPESLKTAEETSAPAAIETSPTITPEPVAASASASEPAIPEGLLDIPPLAEEKAPGPASTPAIPSIAEVVPPIEPSKSEAEAPAIDLAFLAQQAEGATDPIGTKVTPPPLAPEPEKVIEKPIEKPVEKPAEPAAELPVPALTIDDFALPMDLPTPPSPPLEPAPISVEKEKPKDEDPLATLLNEEVPSTTPLSPISSADKTKTQKMEKPPFFEPPKEILSTQMSSLSVEEPEIKPVGLASFTKAVADLTPKEEEPKIEEPKLEEPKFESPTLSTVEEKIEAPVFTPPSAPEPEPISFKETFKPDPASATTSLPGSSKVNLNQCTTEELVRKANCPENIARKIIAWRELHGTFTDLHLLWNIPGMSTEIYRSLTGLPDEESAVELNEIFGIPADVHLTVRDVASRIRSWPFMNGCIIGGMEGLPIAFDCDDKKFAKSICAFAPKLLQHAHDVLQEINEPEAHEVHLMQEDKTISIFRYEHLTLITVNRRKGLSSRDVELLRQVVVKLSNVKGAKLEV